MDKKNKTIGGVLLAFLALVVSGWYLHGSNIQVLNPKGPVAAQERHLMIVAVLLMLVVVIPVFIITFSFAWKYREANHKHAKYTPDWDHNRLIETIWWLIPSALILCLAVITWNATHKLDPSKAIASRTPLMTIQVVALDWKWLFIYPEQHIATVNYVQIPVNTPIDFAITSDAPMNSFWIPQLSGQIYAMPGMATNLNLMASSTGSFRGSSANISGQGFAGMSFVTKATTKSDFSRWVATVKKMPNQLNQAAYNKLAEPSTYNQPAYYGAAMPGIFDAAVIKYMVPASSDPTAAASAMAAMQGMEMR